MFRACRCGADDEPILFPCMDEQSREPFQFDAYVGSVAKVEGFHG